MSQNYFYGVIPVKMDVTEEVRKQVLFEFPAPKYNTSNSVFSIENEIHGNKVTGVVVLLNEFKVEKASNGNSFLKMTFENNLGTFNAKMWDNDGAVEFSIPLLEQHAVFEIAGKIEEFKGFKSITLNRLQPSTSNDINPFDLLAYTEQNIEDFIIELYTYLDGLEPPYKEIALKGMTRFWKEFSIRPAAKGYHHNYLTGLLKHTVSIMRIARYLLVEQPSHYKGTLRLIQAVEKAHKEELWENLNSDKSNDIRKLTWADTIDHLYAIFCKMGEYRGVEPNYSQLMCSIFYHDLGKIMEYHHAGKGVNEFEFLFPTADSSSLSQRKPSGITMDELGGLVGHIPLGMMLFNKIVETSSISISLEEIFHILHNISCHHGKVEWGSSVRPQSIEGYLIHLCDFLDSRFEKSEKVK
jgi:23S rRNA maturation-related 3'-5' exoribonuclease YhaM